MTNPTDIFAVPIMDKFLIYAPLHHFAALVDHLALEQIRIGLQADVIASTTVQPMVDFLRCQNVAVPLVRSGVLDNPCFLGLIPTRGCNMGCRYCDFAAPKKTSPVMDFKLAREAINAYMNLLADVGHQQAEVHFFGGEPFYAKGVVYFSVGYATLRAAELGLSVRFEATTNGLFSPARCDWVADHFDTIVLSLDGPADIQNDQRPALNGRDTFAIVTRNAKVLANAPVELIVRICVTHKTVTRLPEIATWISQELHPDAVCFETLTASPTAQRAQLEPPDPWEFAHNFDTAACLLAEYDIETVLSTADLSHCQATFCPVGRDALIISPEGTIDACYLLEKDWSRNGLDMRLGRLTLPQEKPPSAIPYVYAATPSDESEQEATAAGIPPILDIDPHALQRVRSLNVYNRPLCLNCLCRYHCAGGCHVNHDTSAPPGHFDTLCIQTRLITIAGLLRKIGQHNLVKTWFARRPALETAVWQNTDRLLSDRERPP